MSSNCRKIECQSRDVLNWKRGSTVRVAWLEEWWARLVGPGSLLPKHFWRFPFLIIMHILLEVW